MILGIADDLDAAPALHHRIALGNRLSRVVGPFCLNIRANLADDRPHIKLGKDDNRIHVSQSGYNFRPFVLGYDWPPFAFQCAYRLIGIDRDHKLPTQRLRPAQIAHMPHMK